MNYIIASHHEWNELNFKEFKSEYESPESLFFIDSKESLNLDYIDTLNPRYIFFPHWSFIVPQEILNKYDCICFHMTDLPFGRGGSPLQNLIINNYLQTKITALKMTEELDAGPIYFKEILNLDGSAEDIYKRASKIIFYMIGKMINDNMFPEEQTGEVTSFKRRIPAQSEIKDQASLEDFYNFIRMLDAPNYPKAFFNLDGFNYEFSGARLDNEDLKVNVKIKKIDKI